MNQLSESIITNNNRSKNTHDDKHQNKQVLVLFLCLAANRAEQFGTNQNKLEHVRTGHSESHCFLRDCA